MWKVNGEKKFEEEYKEYSPFKGSRKREYEILRDGDLNCKHERVSRQLNIDSGCVFVEFECVRCGRRIAECLGECHNPEDFNKNWSLGK